MSSSDASSSSSSLYSLTSNTCHVDDAGRTRCGPMDDADDDQLINGGANDAAAVILLSLLMCG